MAATISEAFFNGSRNYSVILEVDVSGTTIYATVRVRKNAGTGYRTANAQWYRLRIAGQDFDGTWTYDFSGSSLIEIRHASRAVGYGTHLVEAWVNMDSGLGQGYTVQTKTLVRPASAPSAPSITGVSEITTTSAKVSYNPGANNGSAITETQWQWSRNSTFTDVQWVDQFAGAGGATRPAGAGVQLTPGTTYYVRGRHRNSVNWGAYSGYRQVTLLPSTAPPIAVGPSLDGRSATVTLSPPGGASGVTQYVVERQLVAGGTVVSATTATRSLSVVGLTPGAAYRWRAAAKFSTTYTSPWSAWLSVTQPNPNTNPGDFFDGSFPKHGDTTFRWLGTAGLSQSVAESIGVAGWEASPAGTVVLQRVTGGAFGSYAARMLFIQDAQTDSLVGIAGASRSAVEPDTTYVGSIYVRPSREQRLAVRIIWMDDTGGQVGVTTSAGQVVSNTNTYTRLSVSAISPATAVSAVVRAVDVAGTGWSQWLSSEYVDADAAMLTLSELFPYFDGSTPDTSAYRYAWLGAAHTTGSSRTTLPPGPDTSLQDPDCPPPPSAPRPPMIEEACIDEAGIWRRFWLTIPESEVTHWLDLVPTFRVLTGTYPARQVRVRYYENPEGLQPDRIDSEGWQTEQIVSYIPPYTVLALDGLSETVTAAVDGADPVIADHLLYGTAGQPPEWPILSCGIGYMVSFDVPLDLPGADLTLSLELTQRA